MRAQETPQAGATENVSKHDPVSTNRIQAHEFNKRGLFIEIWWIELHRRSGMELAGYLFETDARFSLWRWLKRLPGYLRSRRISLRQALGLLKECWYSE